ncbi:HdeD family acid-resistance protein [Butyrivibrio sp. MC2021]|uniref:HdeD family acid-resistance protein n=1 Tax=Butyrivibrio sp. MC2021 TaxID=1408306 RepID=UPI000479F2F4|nr:DUF308 domain-containing protein [Butyrivibrio sp. MC2021]
METAKKFRLHNMAQALIMIGIGLLLVLWPGASLDIMAKALAALLILVGAIFIIAYFFRKDKGFVVYGEFGLGIVLAAVGVWIFFNSRGFTNFIPKLFGVFIVVSGLGNLGQTFTLIKKKAKTWWLSFIIAIVTVFLGGFLLYKPADASVITVTLIGAFLIVDGVTNLLTWIMVIIATLQKQKDEEALVSEAVVVEDSDDDAESVDGEVVTDIVETEDKE